MIVEHLPFGEKRVRPLRLDDLPRSLIEPCATSGKPAAQCGGGGGGGGPSGPSTYLKDLYVIGVCDFGVYPNNCGQDGNKFEWHTYYSSNSGATWTNRTDVQLFGVPPYVEYNNINVFLIAKRATLSNERIQTDIIEFDGSWGHDTWYPAPWAPGNFGSMQNVGASRCGAPRPGGGNYGCPPAWAEINQVLIGAN